jgi:hypothetical protein
LEHDAQHCWIFGNLPPATGAARAAAPVTEGRDELCQLPGKKLT